MSSFQDSITRLKDHFEIHAPTNEQLAESMLPGSIKPAVHTYANPQNQKQAVKKVIVPSTLKTLLQESQHRNGRGSQNYEIHLPTEDKKKSTQKRNEFGEWNIDTAPAGSSISDLIIQPPKKIAANNNQMNQMNNYINSNNNINGLNSNGYLGSDDIVTTTNDLDAINNEQKSKSLSLTSNFNFPKKLTLTPSERIGSLYSPGAEGLSPKKLKDKDFLGTLFSQSTLIPSRSLPFRDFEEKEEEVFYDSRFPMELILNKEFTEEEKAEIVDTSIIIERNEKGGFIPLEMFDDDSFESRTPEQWIALGGEKGTRARSRYFENNEYKLKACYVIGYDPNENKYEIVWENEQKDQQNHQQMNQLENKEENSKKLSKSKFVKRFNLIFDDEDENLFNLRIRCAQMRRRNAEREIRFALQVDRVKNSDVTPMSEDYIHEILRHVANEFPQEHVNILKNNLEEVDQEYIRSMKRTILEYELKNELFEKTLTSTLDLPRKKQDSIIRKIGTVDVPTYDFVSNQNKLAAETFYTRPILAETLVKVHDQARFFENISFMDLDISYPCSLFQFLNDQTNSLLSFVQKLKKDWTSKVTQIIQLNITEEIYDFYKVDVIEKYKNSRMRRVIRLVNLMLSHQLRSMIEKGMNDFVTFFSQFENTLEDADDPNMPLEINGKTPLFQTTIIDKDGECIFKPSLQQIHDGINEFFDSIYEETRQISEITNTLYPLLTLKEYHLQTISFDEDIFKNAKKEILSIIKGNFEGPMKLLSLYKSYEEVLNFDAEKYAEQFAANFPNQNPTLDDYREEVERVRSIADKVISISLDEVNFDLIRVDCSQIKDILSEYSYNASKSLLNYILTNIRERSSALAKRYAEIFRRLQDVPQNAEELDDLKKFAATIPDELSQTQSIFSSVQKSMDLLNDFGFNVQGKDFSMYTSTFGWPKEIMKILNTTKNRLQEDTHKFQDQLQSDIIVLFKDVSSYMQEMKLFSTFNDIERVEKFYAKMQEMDKKIENAIQLAALYNSREQMFNLPVTEFREVEDLVELFAPHKELWTIAYQESQAFPEWLEGSFQNLDPAVVEENLMKWLKSLSTLTKSITDEAPRSVATGLFNKLSSFKKYIPLIKALRNKGLRDRHWKKISQLIHQDVEFKESLKLTNLIDMKLEFHLAAIQDISEYATKEYAIEINLEKMEVAWKSIEFTLEPISDSYKLVAIEEIQTLLDDQIIITQAIRASPYVKEVEADVIAWEKKLLEIQDILDEWLRCQVGWLYLEPIFSSQDISAQLPKEASMFDLVDKIWRAAMEKTYQSKIVTQVVTVKNIHKNFAKCNKKLDEIQRSLRDYLETKRVAFPRLYFLSDDELLQILSETKVPERVQPHLKKTFDGINELVFHDDVIIAMRSKDGEEIPFISAVIPSEYSNKVEIWLYEVVYAMQKAVRQAIITGIQTYPNQDRLEWALSNPGQIVLAVSQLYWTREVEEAMSQQGVRGVQRYMAKLKRQMEKLIELVRGDLTESQRIVLGALTTIDVHAKDVVSELIKDEIEDIEDFDWKSQLRYNWENDQLIVQQITTTVQYGYEYLGNSSRLVITPLTDRCYRTLMSALQLSLGGAPEGPAGTGKTETVKDLSKSVAHHCLVYNCSESLDTNAMEKFFRGISSSGAWSCFDEFNRIELEVLSVIAQQILQIQNALRAKVKVFNFMGVDIPLNHGCAIYITMNPGYAGRSNLPDNLKTLFRPVAMMIPDYAMIAEISLFSFGFIEGRDLARKIVSTYRLCSEQLSAQDHYDYGMRAVKAVFMRAGELKRNFPTEDEYLIILKSIRDVNLPKFLDQDIPLFEGIVRDLFPMTKYTPSKQVELIECIIESCKKLHLQSKETFLEKVIQLYEMIVVRHGVMLVGKTFSGKTSIYRVLKNALNILNSNYQLEHSVEALVMNPKSITLRQLYGTKDESTTEWIDGILSYHFRRMSDDPNNHRKWIIFDGPVDAIWIESMNTVLDDNRKLCLSSGEIIKMAEHMTMMFEVADLAFASPATVSRCGMIYVEPHKLSWRPLFESYMMYELPEYIKSKELLVNAITNIINWLVPPLLNFVSSDCKEYVSSGNIGKVSSFLDLFDSLLNIFKVKKIDAVIKTEENEDEPNVCEASSLSESDQLLIIESQFLFALIWSFGGPLDDESRSKFDKFFRNELDGNNQAEEQRMLRKPLPYDFSTKIPKTYSIFDYVYVNSSKRWIYWMDTIEKKSITENIEYHQLLIPTVESTRSIFLLNTLINNQKQILLVGPTGTGKTAYIKEYMLNKMDPLFIPAFLYFSARTSANQTQDVIESKLIKRKKGVIGAPVGKRTVFFIDDLNLPVLETYGAQPPIELLRQWQDYGGWYKRNSKEGSFNQIVDIQFIAAMGPPDGGRNPISPRFSRHFNIISMNPQSNEVLTHIFSEIVDWFLQKTDFASAGSRIVQASVSLFRKVISAFKPRPSKSHYTFNMRDLSKIFQGMVQMKPSQITSRNGLLRLWCHEATRVFRDRLVNEEDRHKFDSFIREELVDTLTATKDLYSESTIFCSFMNTNSNLRQYEEVEYVEEATTRLKSYLEEYNEMNNNSLDLVLFRFAVEHVARIHRIITQPLGNALLIGVGGSGRQSLTRLATAAAGYKYFQINITKNYTVSNWKDDMIELALNTGLKCQDTVFLFADTQIKDIAFLEDINNLLNTGEIPNLFTSAMLNDIQESIRKAARDEGRDQSPLSLYNFFIERCRKHLHVVVCMSPVGDSLRNYIRQFPFLINTTAIDWFSEWPQEALLSVAKNYIRDIGFDDNLVSGCSSTIVTMHSSIEELSIKYLKETGTHTYVTPTSYLELLHTLKTMYYSRRQELLENKNKYDNGIKSINETEDQVAIMQRDLEILRPKLLKLSKENEELSKTIEKESIEANETRKVVEAEEEILNRQNAENEKVREECQQKLDLALPALRQANKALGALQKNHIVEVRSLKSPPKGVKLVMKAVCIIKNVDPIYVEEGIGKKKPDYWEPAKKMMSVSGFLSSLIHFDMSDINDSVVQKLKPVISLPEFNEKDLRRASVAAAGLAAWAIALVNVHEIQKVVRPRQEALERAEAQARESLKQLNAAKDQLRILQEKLERLEEDKKNCILKQEKLEAQFKSVTLKLERAKNLLSLLGGEKIRWEQTSNQLSEQIVTLRGDSLLCSGIVSYLGPYTSSYRSEIIELWKDSLKSSNIPISKDFSLIKLLSTPTKVREWTLQGLPRDDFSLENAIIVENSNRWPLFIDPQGQATKWIRKMEEEKGYLVVKMSDPHLIKTIEKAIQIGTSVIIENIGEEIDPALDPLLLKQTSKIGGVLTIRLTDNAVEYNEKFRFYMITSMPYPHYLPDISTKVSIVNFLITPNGLEDQLLAIVVSKDKGFLEKKKNEIVTQTAENRKILEKNEQEILNLLADSENILEDDKAIDALANAKQVASKIKSKQAESIKNEEEIDKGRLEYEPVAKDASNLFFVVSDLSRVDPMYQFSLSWYTDFFKSCIDETSKVGNRIQNLILNFREILFDKVCRSIFEKDKLLFSFLMCIQIMKRNQQIDDQEWRFLLTGGTSLLKDELKNPAPEWLLEGQWNEISALRNVPSMATFPDEFVNNIAAWKDIQEISDPLHAEFPGKWKDATQFQRMIIIRLIRPDKIIPIVRQFIINNLGSKFLSSPSFDINISYQDSTCETPMIFILSPGVDPMVKLQAFCEETLGEGAILESVSLGQGQGRFATEKISKAVIRGNWVVLQNCHLAISWLPTLEKIIDEFKIGKTAATFRLWLTSMPTENFPINILKKGIKMTNEPPKGIKANLYQSWNNAPISNDSFFKSSDKSREFKKLLFGLCFFHAVVQERRKFGPLGWNILYEFNESDLVISIHQLKHFLDSHSYIPFKALMYITGECNYGGRVTDNRDRRTLNAILSDFFCEDILEEGYKFSSSSIYYAPPDSTHKSYSEYIENLPSEEQPEVFGLHTNASITKDATESMNLFKSALVANAIGVEGSNNNLEVFVTEQAKDILTKLPILFNIEEVREKFPVCYEESMNSVLIQELIRFNQLIKVIKRSLINVQKALAGEIVLSRELEQVANSIMFGQIPEIWKTYSYPTLKPLSLYIIDLIKRIDFFTQWVNNGIPTVIWLSGFFFTQSFLTGIKQNYARKHVIEIDRIEWDFEIMNETPTEPPENGCYIHGLYIEGASWDPELKQLVEAKPKKIYDQMPIIWLKPTVGDDIDNYPHYLTPLYKTTDRHGELSTTGHSTNYVMSVKIPTADYEEKHWIKRATALFLNV